MLAISTLARIVKLTQSSLGVNEMIFGRYRPVQETIDRLDAVNSSRIRSFADNYLNFDKADLMILGDRTSGLERKVSKLKLT